MQRLCEGCSSKGWEYNELDLEEILISITTKMEKNKKKYVKYLCCDGTVFFVA